MIPEFSRIAVKVGSNLITQSNGSPGTGKMLRIVKLLSLAFNES